MKTVFFLLCSLFTGLGLAQEGIPYLDFTAKASGNQVEIKWVVKQGNTCRDVEVWRGTDSTQLTNIYTYVGICGDADSNRTYRYHDFLPSIATTYFYQIKVDLDKTAVRKIQPSPNSGIQIHPNPTTDVLNIYKNPNEVNSSVSVYNSFGKQIIQFGIDVKQQPLNVNDWPRGVYFFYSTTGSKTDIFKVLLQ